MSEWVKLGGKLFEAFSKKGASNYNAGVSESNAVLVRQAAQIEENRQRRIGRRHIGSMRAAIGASGVTIDGSALDVIEDSAREIELDALTIRHRGEREAAGLTGAAALERATGRSELGGAVISAAGDLLD